MDLGRPWVQWMLAIALALVVGAIVWMATGEDDGQPVSTTVSSEADVVSERELAALAAAAGHPVYWAGPIAGAALEETEKADGEVFVSYSKDGTEAGDGTPQFLAVGTYVLPDPAKALEGFARRPGAVVRRSPGLGEVVTNRQAPSSVYFASPDNRVQVEVYSPSPKRAMSLVLSGRIQPVG
jgi:hypothetical protein